MFKTLINTYYHILFKSNKFISFAKFGFFTFSLFNSDNNRGPFFKKFRILNSCNNNSFQTSLVHYVGIRIVDFNSSTLNRPLRSKFYTITYCSFFNRYKYRVDLLIRDEPLSSHFINYLVYILNIRFNLTGRYFYTGFFSASYLQTYKFFTLVTSPNYIKIYLVNNENYEMYVNLLNTGGLYVLDYDLYPKVIRRGRLSFSSNPISYREVPLSNIITRNHIESFTSSEIEVALLSDYNNKYYKYLTGHLNVNHWDLTQEGYIFCHNKSTFFSSYYKNSLEGFTIEDVSKDIMESPKPLTSSILYLVKALNMRFNISGRYFYYEGLRLNIKEGEAKFYHYAFSKKKIPCIKVYKVKDSNLKDFLMVLKYGTKKFDVEYSFHKKHVMMEYDGTVKFFPIKESDMIYRSIIEYYFCHKINRFIENQLRSNRYGERIPLAPYRPKLPLEEE